MDVKSRAAQLIGDGVSNITIRELASEIAEAQVDLIRIRQMRDAVLTDALRKCAKLNQSDTPDRSQVETAPTAAPEPSDVAKSSPSKTVPSPDDATALCDAVHQLHAIHRYELRALSRRKFAIRMFDAARRQQQQPRVKDTEENI
jgi:hypothetical protein